eukprot:4526057-Alexandrium_andersonii.AAC.1
MDLPSPVGSEGVGDGDLPMVALPSDDSGEDDALLQMPEADMLANRPVKRKRRSARVPIPGPSREEMLVGLEMVPSRVGYLWDVVVPRHLRVGLQDDVMEVYSPPRLLVTGNSWGLRGGLSADLETGWDFAKVDHRTNLMIQ